MKVAIIIPKLKFGGEEQQAITLLKIFHNNNIDVDLIHLRSDHTMPDEIPEDTTLIQIGKQNKELSLSNLPFMIKDLCRYLKRRKCGFLLCFGNYIGISAVLARKIVRNKARIAIEMQDHLGLKWNHEYNSVISFIMPKLIKTAYSNLTEGKDTIVTVSNGIADNLIEITGLPKGLVQTIYNPTIVPELLTKSEEILDHPWLTNKEAPVFLAVGRLDRPEKKGFFNLLNAFKKVVARQHARLIILGGPVDKSPLPEFINELDLEESVSLPGQVDNPYPYFKQADIFVLSSNWEGLPGVLIEALALTPSIISTDCPSGPKEILENGKWGRLIPVDNTRAMAEAMLEALDELPAKRAPKEAWERFTTESVAQQYIDVLFPGNNKSKQTVV